jgi:inorganic pyrophosphatase
LSRHSLNRLPTFGEDDHVHVVETPKGSPNKYAFSESFGAFPFKMILPEGTSFPYDFGMIPSTRGADGDPLDLLLDAPAFPVACRRRVLSRPSSASATAPGSITTG